MRRSHSVLIKVAGILDCILEVIEVNSTSQHEIQTSGAASDNIVGSKKSDPRYNGLHQKP